MELSGLQALDVVLVPTSYLRLSARLLPQLDAALAQQGLPQLSGLENVVLGTAVLGLEVARAGLLYCSLIEPFLR